MNLFFVFLGTAAWQDLRTRSISLEVLAGGAAVGKERLPGEIVLAMIPGIMLLLIGMLTRGLLGEGDGWFFIVTGFFLGWQECVMLLISGQIFCGIFGLAIMVGAQIGTGRENIRKLRLPFLPFLLPASLWMVLMRMI